MVFFNPEGARHQLAGDMSGGGSKCRHCPGPDGRPRLMLWMNLPGSLPLVKEIYGTLKLIGKKRPSLVEQNAHSLSGQPWICVGLGRIVMTIPGPFLPMRWKEFYLGIKEESIRGTRWSGKKWR
jgi:hypothetical protein